MGRDETEEELATIADQPSSVPSTAPLYVLRVVSGPSTGKTLVLDWNKMPQVLVGKSQVCELAMTDPRISRRHLSLTSDGSALRLADLQSTNGTRVGGVRIVEALLEGGELIELGESGLRVARAGEIRVSGSGSPSFGRVLGKSQAMQRVFSLAEALAGSMLPVIIEGETGTGKELLAEAIHETGPRAQAPFIVFDGAAHAHDEAAAVEALFGGARGPGALEQARGGTLLIDEIGELGLTVQSRIASLLDRGELRRAGEVDPVRVNVRFLATTRDDLDRLVEEGKFREELLFRFAGARIQVPPLRQRHGDVELIARHFWKLFGGPGELPKRILLQLARHAWPGNVQELEHAVSRATVLGDDHEIDLARPSQRPSDYLDHVLTMGLAMPSARQLVIREFERRFVERAVREQGGNVTRAAAASGLTRRYFHMLLAKNKT